MSAVGCRAICCVTLTRKHMDLMQDYPEPHLTCAGTQIDILITNCSLYCPTPSLSSLVVNHFKMRSNIISYSLGGMGCSAGVIAVGLAKELLQARAPRLCFPAHASKTL